MSVVVADNEVSRQTEVLQDAYRAMAGICSELSSVLKSVTAPGGGLESSAMKEAIEKRAAEAQECAARLNDVSDALYDATTAFLSDIDRIDQYIY